MSGLFDNKKAIVDWAKVRDLADVYAWHCKHTPWLGKPVIEDLMKQYVELGIQLEEGTLPQEKLLDMSEYQRKVLESEGLINNKH